MRVAVRLEVKLVQALMLSLPLLLRMPLLQALMPLLPLPLGMALLHGLGVPLRSRWRSGRQCCRDWRRLGTFKCHWNYGGGEAVAGWGALVLQG